MLAGVRASLEASRAFEVITVNANQANEQKLLSLSPDAIIFDTDFVKPEFYFDLIQQCSMNLLIGIDPDSSNVFLWSVQQLHELSAKGLVELILGTERSR